MPAPNQTEPEPQTIDITPTWHPILVHSVTALFESWAKPADEDWTNTQRTAARLAAIDTLTDAALKLDGANAALAVAVEEIDRLARQSIGSNMDALDPYGNDGRLQDELTQAAAKDAARSIARIRAALNRSQA